MSEAIKPLEEVRREIDEIDAALHDLIMRRTRVVEQVPPLCEAVPGATFGIATQKPTRCMPGCWW